MENCVLCEKNRTQNSVTLLVQLRETRLEKNTHRSSYIKDKNKDFSSSSFFFFSFNVSIVC